ncbi:hypothetical protein ACJRO7_006646 [Eucalyptus globulus]|uniref:Uncharacterized protein n=1 Tax=Eucalyptus globulus TaxID=34317 RepID=A0ABD3IJB6_EUCGL
MPRPDQVPSAENAHITSTTPLESCCSRNRIPDPLPSPSSSLPSSTPTELGRTRARGGPEAGARSKSEDDGKRSGFRRKVADDMAFAVCEYSGRHSSLELGHQRYEKGECESGER